MDLKYCLLDFEQQSITDTVQLTKQFQGRRFLEIDQSETRMACGGHIC
jgi:hypothetical protein